MKQSELKSFIKENIIDILSEATEEEVANQKELNKELEKTAKLQKHLGEDEDHDKDAVKGAMKARGKFKKLDLAVQELKDLETEMRSLARKFSAAKNEDEKQAILNMLKKKTSRKKELESLVAKLEKDVV